MGNLSGQDTNSLLSRRLKRMTSDRQSVVRKQEQPSSVVAKIERVLFAYRETLAYYQDMLEQFEEEFSANTNRMASEQVIVPENRHFQQMTEQLKECIQELERQIQAFEVAGTNQLDAFQRASNSQLSAFQEASATQLNNLEALAEQAKFIPAPPIREEVPVVSNPAPAPVSYEKPDTDEVMFVDESLGVKSYEETASYGVNNQNADYLNQLEAYNNNLSEIKKRLDDLMRFVGKVDGSIIETLKTHTNGNKDAIMEQLMELKSITTNSRKGLKPLLVFNFILGLLNVGGLTFFILYYLDIIKF